MTGHIHFTGDSRKRDKERKKQRKTNVAALVLSTSPGMWPFSTSYIYPQARGGKRRVFSSPFFPCLHCPGLFDMWSIPAKASLIDRPKWDCFHSSILSKDPLVFFFSHKYTMPTRPWFTTQTHQLTCNTF